MKIKDAETILEKYKDELKSAPCSKDHHLNIEGGLLIHLDNIKRIAEQVDPKNETLIAIAMIHDIGKARVYKIVKNKTLTYDTRDGMIKSMWDGTLKIEYYKPDVDHLIHTINMIGEAGIHLTVEELHALQFHHGGYSPFKGQMNELAIKLHYCDMMATFKEEKKEGKNGY